MISRIGDSETWRLGEDCENCKRGTLDTGWGIKQASKQTSKATKFQKFYENERLLNTP